MWFWHRCPLIHHPPVWYDVVIQEQKSVRERYALVMPLTAEPNIEKIGGPDVNNPRPKGHGLVTAQS